jgi:hypothetical protein
MAIRKSEEEEFVVVGTTDIWAEKCKQALDAGGFKNIKHNQILNQLEADYKTFKVVGSIVVTLLSQNENTVIKLKSTGNMDNIFALMKSPNSIILASFKDNIKSL